MEAAFDLILWRASLADAAPVPTRGDLEGWAERLAAAGAREAAALLADVAAISAGFSPQLQAMRRGAVPFAATTGEWTLHQALNELRELGRSAAAAGLPRLAVPQRATPSGRPDNPAGIGDGIPAPMVVDDVALAARDLRAALESATVDETRLAALLGGIAEADRRLPTLDYRSFASSPLEVLVPAIALAGLIDFALRARDLWQAPSGSCALFHHAARLDGAGLGPYFGNIRRLARDSRDMVDLARAVWTAAREAGDTEADIEAWLVLLSRGAGSALLYEVIDDLGDSGRNEALCAILDRVASRPAAAIDIEMVMRLRDAGLDNGDPALAARAQRIIVRLHPDSKLEAMILTSIEADGGEFGRAEAILREWLLRSPDDEEVQERLLAVRQDRSGRFSIPYGFGSPADRRDARLRRRGVAPDYPRRRGERIRAVDVG